MGLQLSLNSFTFLRLLSHFDLVSHNTQNSSVVNDRKVAFTAEREVAMAPLWKKLLSEKANANPLALLFFMHSHVSFLAFNRVGFTAYASFDVGFNTLDNILFDVIVFNDGGGYDASTSVFTCPVSGLYLFSLNVYVSSFERMEAVMRVNGVTALTAYASNAEANGSSNTLVINCEEGQTVDVVCGPHRNDCDYNNEDFQAVNTFSGVLITENIDGMKTL